MIIGVDACCWSNRRGFGRFTRELLTTLVSYDTENEYRFFADRATAEGCSFPSGATLIAAETEVAATEAASAEGRRSLGDLWALTREVARHDLDLFFFPAVYSYYPILNRTPIVLTIHDVIAHHHAASTFPNKKNLYFWKLKQYLALFQADALLTVSEYSRQSISAYYNRPAEQIHVTTEGANPEFQPLAPGTPTAPVLARYGLTPETRFLLYVGGISPHKNLGTLVEALRLLRAEADTADVRLVLVGDYQNDAFQSDYPRLKAQVDALDMPEAVVFTGYVPDADLVYLYNAAVALAFPSLEEGFGLPAIEAMQCGTPVVVSNRGSLPEIVGPAGRLFDPTSPAAILAALQPVLQDADLRLALQRKSLEQAKQFTWEEAARRTLALFERLL